MLFYKLVDKVFNFLFPNWQEQLRKDVEGMAILDIGCGDVSPIRYFKVKDYLGIDIYAPCIESARKHSPDRKHILGDVLEMQLSKWECVVATGIIEHMDKDSGLLDKLINLTTKKLIITCPNGWLHQDALDGNPYQVHKSAWYPSDFTRLGFKVYGMYGWKYFRTECAKTRWQPAFLWEVICGITQWFVYRIPSQAHMLYCVLDKRVIGKDN